MQASDFREQFTAIADAWVLAQGIVDTVREPVSVLDKDLRVIGKPEGFAPGKSGLGTGIVKALAHQLDAQVEATAGPGGTTVSITHATFPAKAIKAA